MTRSPPRDAPIVLESMTFPDPVISVAVEPKSKGDQDKLGTGLQRLAEEDPTFRVATDEETGQTSSPGWASCTSRSSSTASSGSSTSTPTSAVRRSRTERDGGPGRRDLREKFVRQTGGSGQYADVVINLRPQEPGAGYEFNDKITGGKIPREYIPAVDAGIKEAMQSGVIAGYPVVDVGSSSSTVVPRRRLSERASKIAGSIVQGGAQALKPKPARADDGGRGDDAGAYLGDVMGNLKSRRGRIESMSRSGTPGRQSLVPLSEMFGDSTDSFDVEAGADFDMDFDLYEEFRSQSPRDHRLGAGNQRKGTGRAANGQAEVRAD